MSGELFQNDEYDSQSSKFNIVLEMFSSLIPLLDANKFVIASVTSVVFLAFACLTLAVSAVALVVSAPLFIIFSPILVPATIATTLLATGFTAAATLGLTAIGLIIGLIKTAEGTPLALSTQRPLKLLKFSGGYWGFLGGKTFSGSFGDILKWLKKQPWFKEGIPAGGAAPPSGGATPGASEAAPLAAGGAVPAAGGAAPAAGGAASPAGGATPGAGGATPPAGGAAPPAAGGATPPAGGAAPPAAGGAASPAAGGAAPPAAGGAAPPAGGAAPSM
ncbi:hypothetical protein N665_1540s0003 [Sinapis alba]|nr:hypothetical protein N665_1540s0003 [Sinapis alba]